MLRYTDQMPLLPDQALGIPLVPTPQVELSPELTAEEHAIALRLGEIALPELMVRVSDDQRNDFSDTYHRVPLLKPEEVVILAKLRDRGRTAERQLELPENAEGLCTIALAKAVAAGARAKQHLIVANLGLVDHFVNQKGLSAVQRTNAIDEATIGLVAAAGNFDYTRGVAFSTYASATIKWHILKAQATTRVDPVLFIDSNQISGSGTRLFPDPSCIETEALQPLRREILTKVIEEATFHYKYVENERAKLILRESFGFNETGKPLTQEEIARRINRTRQRVSRIRQEALGILLASHPELRELLEA